MQPQSIFSPADAKNTKPNNMSDHKECTREALLMYRKGYLHGLVEAARAIERQIPIVRDIIYQPGTAPLNKLDAADRALFDQSMKVLLAAVKIEAVEFAKTAAEAGQELDADDIRYILPHLPPTRYATF